MTEREAPVRECGCELCTTSAMLRAHNPAHGKASTYRRYGCRCEACTRAASEAQRKTRANHTNGSGA